MAAPRRQGRRPASRTSAPSARRTAAPPAAGSSRTDTVTSMARVPRAAHASPGPAPRATTSPHPVRQANPGTGVSTRSHGPGQVLPVQPRRRTIHHPPRPSPASAFPSAAAAAYPRQPRKPVLPRPVDTQQRAIPAPPPRTTLRIHPLPPGSAPPNPRQRAARATTSPPRARRAGRRAADHAPSTSATRPRGATGLTGARRPPPWAPP